MVSREFLREQGSPLPHPRQAWPPPPAAWIEPDARSPRCRHKIVGCAAALLFGVIGVVGALLPPFDGQKVGDPDSTAFRVGVPLGFFGGVIALVVGIIFVSRSSGSTALRVVTIVSIVVGGIALLLTMALVFSG
jgi:hypothetical protein